MIAPAEPFDLSHCTEFEKLWIAFDPEFSQTHQAMQRLRRHSAQAPEFFIVLQRVHPFITFDHEKFEMIPYRTFSDALRAMHHSSYGAEPVAIARAGTVLSCRKKP